MIDGFFTPQVCCFAAGLGAIVAKTPALLKLRNWLGSKWVYQGVHTVSFFCTKFNVD